MTIPIALQDRPMRVLAEYLKTELNDRLHLIFDDAEEPRQDAVKTAVPWNPDLRAIRDFPLLAVFRTECTDFGAGQWRAIARWHCTATTLQIPYQQDYLYWIGNNLMSILEEYHQSSGHDCVEVEVQSLRAQISYVTVTTPSANSDRLVALSFPTVQVNFDFADLEA